MRGERTATWPVGNQGVGFEMNPKAVGLHCLFPVERRDGALECVRGRDAEIIIILPTPDTDDVPADLDVSEREVQGPACGAGHRTEGCWTRAESAIMQGSVNIFLKHVDGHIRHGGAPFRFSP